MKYRKLRIAWCVAWGVACLLLCALWIRSLTWLDRIDWPISQTAVEAFGLDETEAWAFVTGSQSGLFLFQMTVEQFDVVANRAGRIRWSGGRMGTERTHFETRGNLGFKVVIHDTSYWALQLPIWAPAMLMAGCAVLPWSRFTLRTLLFGMTLAAIGLGWIAHALRM